MRWPLIFLLLWMLALLVFSGCERAIPHKPAPVVVEQEINGWRYKVIDGKGFLCNEQLGCFIGRKIGETRETPFGPLVWTGPQRGWQPDD